MSQRRLARAACLAMSLGHTTACFATMPLDGRTVASPVELRGVPENHLVRWPSVAARSDTVLVAGNVFPVVGDSLAARPAYLGRLHQTSTSGLAPLDTLALPPGDFQFAYPRVVAAGSALHLVWAEFDARPSTGAAWLASYPTSLWHAVLRNGVWSTPERIATSQLLGWNRAAGALSVTDGGVLHVAVWSGDSIPGVHHIRRAGGQHHATRLPYSTWNQATAIAARGDTVLLGLVEQASASFRVMLIESIDQGAHWKAPVIASSREHGSAAGLALAETADGPLLVIVEKPMESFYLDTIRLVRVGDAGGSPGSGLITAPPLTAGVVLAAVPCGGAVMLLDTFSLTPQVFELRVSRGSLATTVGPLLSGAEFAAFPGVTSTRRNPVAVFAYGRSRNVPGRSVAMPLAGCTP